MVLDNIAIVYGSHLPLIIRNLKITTEEEDECDADYKDEHDRHTESMESTTDGAFSEQTHTRDNDSAESTKIGRFIDDELLYEWVYGGIVFWEEEEADSFLVVLLCVV